MYNFVSIAFLPQILWFNTQFVQNVLFVHVPREGLVSIAFQLRGYVIYTEVHGLAICFHFH